VGTFPFPCCGCISSGNRPGTYLGGGSAGGTKAVVFVDLIIIGSELLGMVGDEREGYMSFCCVADEPEGCDMIVTASWTLLRIVVEKFQLLVTGGL